MNPSALLPPAATPSGATSSSSSATTSANTSATTSAERRLRPGSPASARPAPTKAGQAADSERPHATDFSRALARQLQPATPSEDTPALAKAGLRRPEKTQDATEAQPAALDLAALGLAGLGVMPPPSLAPPAQGAALAPALAALTQQAEPASANFAQTDSASLQAAAPDKADALSGHPLPLAESSLPTEPSQLLAPGMPLTGLDRQALQASPRPGRVGGKTLSEVRPQAELSDPKGMRHAEPLSERAMQAAQAQKPATQEPETAFTLPDASPASALAEANSTPPAPWAAAPSAPAPVTTATPNPLTASALGNHSAHLPQTAGSAAWQQALGQQLVFMSQAGLHSAQLQLNPLELGPLQVELRMVEGELRAHFHAEQAGVREVVQAALPQLRTALAEQGLSLGQAQVGSGGRQQDGEGLGGQPSPEFGRAPHRPSPAGNAAVRPEKQATGIGRLHTWA